MVPWTYPQLRRLAVGATTPMTVSISGDTDVMIQYASLRVTYCDETRLAVGGRTSPATAPALHPRPEHHQPVEPGHPHPDVTLPPGGTPRP